jgi:general secretion pathway protein K
MILDQLARQEAPRDGPRSNRRRSSRRRGVALILVLGALTVLTVMLTEFQGETSAELGSALAERDAVKAEYAARSAVNLSRLLLAAEPTIRKGIPPILLVLMGGKAPQIPVWHYASEVLGAFNDDAGQEAFASLSGLDLGQGRNLGMQGASFAVEIVDEDSKINVNVSARGQVFANMQLAGQLMTIMAGPQYDPLFENRDADGQFSDREAICSAIVDWADPDQDTFACGQSATRAQESAAEDSFYEMLSPPYSRKNAAFDSLEELHLVRGISDDFWATFIEPDPDDPGSRLVTVWGQGKINVNTAPPAALLNAACNQRYAYPRGFCDPLNLEQQGLFLMLMKMLRDFTPGIPMFGSRKVFVRTIQGKNPLLAPIMEAFGLEPGGLKSEDEAAKAITTESKVFSIYATGVVKSGKRETRVRIHTVVDFRGAPAPGVARDPLEMMDAVGAMRTASPTLTPASEQAADTADAEGIVGALQKSPGGEIIYFRMD